MADEIINIHNGVIVEFFENPKSEVTCKFMNGELDSYINRLIG